MLREISLRPRPVVTRSRNRRSDRFRNFCFFLLVLSFLFIQPLAELFQVAFDSELLSYILLVPVVFAYLIHLHRPHLPADSQCSLSWAAPLLIIGAAALAFAFELPRFFVAAGPSDHLVLGIFAYVCFVVAGGFLFLGREWTRDLAFPFSFLAFLVPLPNQMVDWLETASQIASAEAADLLFNVSGTPILREGMVFQLPGMVIQVAQECSGIRSSLVLFITSLVAAHLFLRSPWRRLALVAFVIPLGILRNGIRILIIGLLCVHYGPQMIHSVIHRRGGPLFFALSVIPLFLLLWILRYGDRKGGGGAAISGSASAAGCERSIG